MTLLELFDTWGEVGCDPNKIRRALAIAQAVEEFNTCAGMPLIIEVVKRRADELLKEGS